MVERHHDYLLGPLTVPVGGLQDVPLQLDTDAPFALRLVKSRNIGVSGWQYQTPKRLWQSSGLRTDLIPNPAGFLSQPATPTPGAIVYPELIYPIGASIVCNIGNATNSPITNAMLLFRGSKLFADGAIQAPTYPKRISPLPFTYQTIVNGVPVQTGTAGILGNQLQVKNDADFVLRYGVCDAFAFGVLGGPVNSGSFQEVYVMLRDESRKAYSNAPIHVNDLFGAGLPQASGFPPYNDNTVGFLPGLFTPEIYIEKDHSLYFDVFRNDDPASPGFNTPVNLWFRFQGIKVFNRT